MSDQMILLKKLSMGNAGKVFFTDLKERGEIEEQQGKLNKYVENINGKINYAKWKQELVLKYNYLPMKRIAEKIESDKLNYIRKIAEEQKNCAKILSGKEITVQLDLFREFSQKLNEKLHDLQVKIADQKMKNNILREEVSGKRMRLKLKMRENMEVIRSTLQRQGISTKEDIVTLVRSKSMKDRFNPTSLTFDSKRAATDRNAATQRKTTSQHSKRESSWNDILFRECFDKLIISIQTMNSSEDIQSGIYLDVMQKNQKKKYSMQGRYSTKSNISDTIHKRFGSMAQQQIKNNKTKANFDMDWQTFKQLNWKQIMGIIMVKDVNCQKTKQMLRYK